ncbi:MAG TPA: hypothetical protein ENN47_12290 [Mesotoga infera]|uniref:Fibronectin type-III domain-containing protein n=1 Tax=Mesotoga infera TaxID=1236046 RepID=A0A7C1HAZ0_9BACT|nr:hypothetical protein [Mesotoga infera]
MERVFFAVLFTLFIVAAANALYQQPEATFTSNIENGTLVYGGSAMLGWDVVVRSNNIALSNIDIWISNKDSGARVDLRSSPFINLVSYNLYFGTSPTPQLYGTTSSNSFFIDRLSPDTVYYWQIVAIDKTGNRYHGPIWYFETR